MTIGLTGKDSVEAVLELERFIGSGDYVARSVNPRGHLVFAVSLQVWDGKLGFELFWRVLKMCHRAMRGRMLARWEMARSEGKHA